jgi:hypothetical protein
MATLSYATSSRVSLAELHRAMAEGFDSLSKSGALFSGGGCLSGPGARFAYDSLEEYGIIDLIKQLDPNVVRLPRVGANYNLPGSHNQHAHTDRGVSQHFMIANVAVVDTGIAWRLPPTEQLSAQTSNLFPAPAARQKRARAACRRSSERSGWGAR